MKLKIGLPKDLVGSCVLIQTFSENGIKLLTSNYISQDANMAINQNYTTENDLPLWILTSAVFNKNMNNILELKKKQEIGFFIILNNGGKEIRHKYKKEH